MTPSIHLPTTKKKTQKKCKLYTRKNKKKREKFVGKKLVCVSSSHPTCLFQQLLKFFFGSFHPCFSYVYLDMFLAQLGFHRDRCAPVVTVCGHPDRNIFVFHPFKIRKVFQLCFHPDRCVPVVTVCGHPDRNVFVFHPFKIRKVFQLRFHWDRCMPVVTVCGHPDRNVFVFHPFKIRKVFQLRFHWDRCAPVVTVCGHLDRNVFVFRPYLMQSISVMLPSRLVCACCNSLWSSGPKRFRFPPVSYAKYFSYASIETGVCVFLQIQEIIPRKNILLF